MVSINALQCSLSKSADVPAIDASTALAEGKQQDYHDAKNRNLWMAVLANFFGVGRDAYGVALQSLGLLLQESLNAHASKKFSVECKQYHDALFDYSSLPKKRARQPAQITLDTEAEILTIGREMRVWFSLAKKVDLQSGSLAAKSIALVHLQDLEASTGIASCMVSLTHEMKPMSRNMEGLLRAAKKRADPVSRAKHVGPPLSFRALNTLSLSWELVTQRATNSIDGGVFSDQCPGPLNPQPLLDAFMMLQEYPFLSIAASAQHLPVAQHDLAASQLLISAPMMEMKQGGTVWIVNLHSPLEHDSLMAAFMVATFATVEPKNMAFGSEHCVLPASSGNGQPSWQGAPSSGGTSASKSHPVVMGSKPQSPQSRLVAGLAIMNCFLR